MTDIGINYQQAGESLFNRIVGMTLLVGCFAAGDGRAQAPLDWSLEPVPGNAVRLFGADSDFVDGVWVAGRFSLEESPFASRNFIAHWDGAQWIETPAPQPAASQPGRDHSLISIAALSSSDAIAVGAHDSLKGNFSNPQSMRWNGAAWVLLDPPTEIINNGNGSGGFTDVTRTGDTVWAVGDFPGFDPGGDDTPIVQFFAARLDGDQWVTNIPPLYDEIQNQRLARYMSNAVAGLAVDDVWLGGFVQQVGEGPDGPLLVHWDGSTWTWSDIWPLFGSGLADIEDIEAISSDDVWAVGEETVVDGLDTRSVAVLLHWNGSQWLRVAAPDETGRNVSLRTVTARSSQDIFAAGVASVPDGPPEAYLLHFDGQDWSAVPDVELVDGSQFFASAIGAAGELWLAGRANDLPLPGLAQRATLPVPVLFRDGFEE